MFTQELRPPGVPIIAPGTCLIQAPLSPEGRRPRPPARPRALQGWAPALSAGLPQAGACVTLVDTACGLPRAGQQAGAQPVSLGPSGSLSGAPQALSSPPRQIAGSKPFVLFGWGEHQLLRSPRLDPGAGQGWALQSSQQVQPQWRPATARVLCLHLPAGRQRPHPHGTLLPGPLLASPGPGGGTQPVLFTAGP